MAIESTPELLFERPDSHPGVAVLTLHRPESLNSLSWPMIRDINRIVAEVGGDDSIRVLVVTGSGRGFCSGLDLGGEDAAGSVGSVVEVYDRQEEVAGLALGLRRIPQPVIAAVNGPAAGGGFSLTLAADIRIVARSAKFNAAFVRIGLSGGDVGSSYALPRLVGLSKASELLLTGRFVAAEEALEIGLANELVDDGEALPAALRMAAAIVANSPFGVRMTKQVLRRNCDAGSLEEAIELENRTQVLLTRTEDMPEAVAAFLARREPKFNNR